MKRKAPSWIKSKSDYILYMKKQDEMNKKLNKTYTPLCEKWRYDTKAWFYKLNQIDWNIILLDTLIDRCWFCRYNISLLNQQRQKALRPFLSELKNINKEKQCFRETLQYTLEYKKKHCQLHLKTLKYMKKMQKHSTNRKFLQK